MARLSIQTSQLCEPFLLDKDTKESVLKIYGSTFVSMNQPVHSHAGQGFAKVPKGWDFNQNPYILGPRRLSLAK